MSPRVYRRKGPNPPPDHLPAEPTAFPDIVRRCRLDKGLTQAEFAELLDGAASQVQIGRWERNATRTVPRDQALAALSAACTIPLGRLLASAGYPGAPDAPIAPAATERADVRTLAALARGLTPRQVRALIAAARAMARP